MHKKQLIDKKSFYFKYRVGGILRGLDDVGLPNIDVTEDTDNPSLTILNPWKYNMNKGTSFSINNGTTTSTYTYGGTDKYGNHLVVSNGVTQYVPNDNWRLFGKSGDSKWLHNLASKKSGLKPSGRKERLLMYDKFMGFFQDRGSDDYFTFDEGSNSITYLKALSKYLKDNFGSNDMQLFDTYFSPKQKRELLNAARAQMLWLIKNYNFDFTPKKKTDTSQSLVPPEAEGNLNPPIVEETKGETDETNE